MRSDAELIQAFVERHDRPALAELIERHRGPAYDLARRVIRSPELAEDATQEAFMRLIRKAGSYHGTGTFRAWFARMVVNSCRDLLRKRQRAEREAGDEAAIGAASGGDSPEREATAAEVRDAVDALPEEFQLPLVLHFWRGYSHAEVAEALEVPAGTVASRISRGKERLRAALASAALGIALVDETLAAPVEPAAVHAALASRLQELAGAGPGAAAAATLAPAGRLGSAAWLAPVAVLLIAVFSWVALRPSGNSTVALNGPNPAAAPAPAAPGAPGAGTAPAATPEPNTPRARTSRLRAEDATGEPGLGAVTLRVVDTDGRPVPGARVAFTRHPFEWNVAKPERADEPSTTATTGPDGRARIEVRFLGIEDFSESPLNVAAPGYLEATRMDPDARAGIERDLGDVVLERGATVRGQVVDADDHPVAGAHVWTRRFSDNDSDDDEDPIPGPAPAGWVPDDAVTTDAAGRFELTGLAADDPVVLVQRGAELPVRAAVPDPGSLGPDGRMRIRLPRSVRLHGRVTGATGGGPIRVTARFGGSWRFVEALSDGTFVFPAVPMDPAAMDEENSFDADAGATLGAVRADQPASGLSGLNDLGSSLPGLGGPFDPATPIEIELAPSDYRRTLDRVVTLRVVDDATGAPITAIAIKRGGWSWHWGTYRESPDGLYLAEPNFGDSDFYLLRARGYALARFTAPGHAPGAGSPFEVRLSRQGHRIQGRVVDDATGKPVAGAIITMSHAPRMMPHPVTGADGRFDLPFLLEGQWHVWANAPQHGYVEAAAMDVPTDGPPITLRLQRAATVAGRVLEADGSPAAGVIVRIEPPGRPDQHTNARTGSDGRFAAFTEITPGSYLVGVDRAGGLPATGERQHLELKSGETREIVIRRLPRVAGRISLARMPERATVRQVYLLVEGQYRPAKIAWDARTRCVDLPHAVPGTYRVGVKRREGPPLVSRPFQIPATGPFEVVAEFDLATFDFAVRVPPEALAASSTLGVSWYGAGIDWHGSVPASANTAIRLEATPGGKRRVHFFVQGKAPPGHQRPRWMATIDVQPAVTTYAVTLQRRP